MRNHGVLVATATLASIGLAGCQLAVEFDRSRLEGVDDRDAAADAGAPIDSGIAPAADAAANPGPDADSPGDAAPEGDASSTSDAGSGADASEDDGG